MKYNDKWIISEFEPKTDILWVQPVQEEEGESGVRINAFVNGKWKSVSGGGSGTGGAVLRYPDSRSEE